MQQIKGGRSSGDITVLKYNRERSDMRMIIHSNLMMKLDLRGKLVNLFLDPEEEKKTKFYLSIADGLNDIIHAHKISLDSRKTKASGMINSKNFCMNFLTDEIDRVEFIYSGNLYRLSKMLFIFRRIDDQSKNAQ